MIIFIYGDDTLRVKERASEMRQKFADKFDPAGMNVDEFVVKDGLDAERGAVIGAAQASPFLAEKRMVIIRNLVSSLKKAESKPWLEGFSKVPSSTILIFADSVTPAALEKSEIFKVLHDQPDVHTYSLPQLEGGELTSWSAARAKFHGVNISSSVLASLLARTGNDSWRIDAELQKLGAYAAHEPVTPAMVTALVRVESDEDIFAFMDALASGQAVKTLQKLSEERAAGADAFQLFGMLARQIRLLLQARAILDLNPKAQKQDLADGLSIHPFVAQKLLTEVRSWSAEKLESLHGLAFKLDKSMKTGLDPDISVDRLVTSFLKVS
ncbi:MAG: polymerase subunit delta [Patescibacteria group bacterium]|jgi:DNA polymerase-3 subunit delta|nr:polymerase subunit delta [Patescibacteria group bacterium]